MRLSKQIKYSLIIYLLSVVKSGGQCYSIAGTKNGKKRGKTPMKKQRKIPKSPGPHSPKLAALESEIMEQHLQGKPIAGIQKWLQTEKSISIAYSNLYNFIHRRAEKYSATSGTTVILHFMRLSPDVREEVLQILEMLMHKDLPSPRPVEKKNSAPPPLVKVRTVPEDFLTIRPDDPPGLKRLKRLASLDTTQLEHLPPDLQPDPPPKKQ